jgi:putative hemolysin
MSIPSHKIETLIRAGRWGSKQLQHIKKNTDKLLVTILVWNNIVNTLIASIATQIAINLAKTSGFPEATIIWISTGIITFLLITFWEIVPKSLGSKNAEFLATMSAPLYKILIPLLYPVTLFFEFIIRIFTGKTRSYSMSDEELESFIDMGKDAGTIDDAEHEKLIWVLELDNLTAEDIMTPRVDIAALDEDETVDEAIQFYLKNTHSRIPVYKDTVDKIYSFVTIRDLLLEKEKWGGMKKLSNIHLHKSLKIPLNQPLDRLLEILQKNNKHMAIVIDEYGWVAGLITLEDIIEEVFGEIRDETDKESDEIKEISEGFFSIDATIMIDEVLEEFDLELYHIGLDVKEFSSETVSYILTDKLERFPHTWEVINFPIVVNDERSKNSESIDFKILDILEGKIGRIEVKINKKQS